ncbi:MAG: NAD(P)-dependent alcohol dehydrogenase [candidate division NC10 bacterium]|nr:NAD(P)-dependent alcohol dehydrogenase [candidate division NC10 bacterium]MBI2115421.1 NAD(P)-dependent alcohol dehydrogenase [candidate division NC10 bacterium]MBI2455128.1 NAD(P)-dependent alcohol dehydrogenase [candidate division NC10 bacterium]MBI2561448.1 NAD(P)-dependent alcohol dehydrogenase [candidate division NC10 bacterium]
MGTMKAAVLQRPGEIRVEQMRIPEPGPGEVLVRVRAVGVCGSDVHYYKEGRIGRYVVEKPLILGHESAGEVVALGSGVSHISVGGRVAVEPGVPCRRCGYCKGGRYNLCADVTFMATPPVDGAFAEYIAWPADFVYPLAENLGYAEGALMEPLAVGMHAVRRARLVPGWTVLILGGGPIGQMALLAARAAGAGRIILTDLEDRRLDVASRLGADVTINPGRASVSDAVSAATDEEGPDLVIEAAGTAATVRQSIELVRRGGTVVWIGLPSQDPCEVSALQAIDKEVDILGIFRYANVYPDAIRLAASGKINLAPLVTHRFPLEEARQALDTVAEQKSSAVKVLVEV